MRKIILCPAGRGRADLDGEREGTVAHSANDDGTCEQALEQRPGAPAGTGLGLDDCAVIVTRRLTGIQGINSLLDDDLLVILTSSPRQAVDVLGWDRWSTARPAAAPVVFGDLEIHRGQQRVRWRGRRADLSEREIRLLCHLADRAGGPCSFAELALHVWDAEHGVDASLVHSAVQRLRRKLAAAGVEVRIESVRGYGLRLLAEVSDPRTP
ncbi:winged helix-turn-helix domain-containing protein [Spirillospora sp. NPDC050679]